MILRITKTTAYLEKAQHIVMEAFRDARLKHLIFRRDVGKKHQQCINLADGRAEDYNPEVFKHREGFYLSKDSEVPAMINSASEFRNSYLHVEGVIALYAMSLLYHTKGCVSDLRGTIPGQELLLDCQALFKTVYGPSGFENAQERLNQACRKPKSSPSNKKKVVKR